MDERTGQNSVKGESEREQRSWSQRHAGILIAACLALVLALLIAYEIMH